MACEERVQAGKVNNLISFFENQNESGPAKTSVKQETEDALLYRRSSVVKDYFSNDVNPSQSPKEILKRIPSENAWMYDVNSKPSMREGHDLTNKNEEIICRDSEKTLSEDTEIQGAEGEEVDDNKVSVDYDSLPSHLKGFGVPTVHPAPHFDPESDATILKDIITGASKDKADITKILTQRSSDQRQQIAHAYRQLFGKDLVKDLCRELSCDFEEVVVALMTPYLDFLAIELKKAISGVGTDEKTLIEIICTCDDESLGLIKEAYHRMYKTSLQDDIYGDTSGDLRKVFLSILATQREDPKGCSPETVASQLCATNSKGEPDVDKESLRTVLVTYTRSFLYRTFEAYESRTEKSFAELIDAVCSGHVQEALLTLYTSIIYLPLYYAEELHNALKGLGTRDEKLIRIIVSRSEIDLQDIKDEFLKLFGKELIDSIREDTSGDYKVVLEALVEGWKGAGCADEAISQESEL